MELTKPTTSSGGGAAAKMGENSTGALVANTLYRFEFTQLNHTTKMTYVDSYTLEVFDAVTGEEIGGLDLLAEGDVSGIYTKLNSFRLGH